MDEYDDEDIRGDAVESDPDSHPQKVYRIQAIPSKGLGVVAAIDFALGDLIIVESPLLLFRPEAPMISNDLVCALSPRDRTADSRELRQLQSAFDKLDDGKKEAYMKLDNVHPENECPPLVGIFNTNAYDVQEFDHAGEPLAPPSLFARNEFIRTH